MTKLRWGILGTGMIARKFAADLRCSSRGELRAVASRNLATAGAFCSDFGGKPREGYESLLSDPEVDAVYLSLPNHLHREWTLRSLEAGKHVLCEKPMACNEAEAREMFQAAKRTGRILVEAFMYRLQEPVQRFVRMVHQGAVGDLRLIRTHFTFNRPVDPIHDARQDPMKAGGSLMDVGCYCIDLARWLTGAEPEELQVLAERPGDGVDHYAAGTMRMGRTLVSFTCGMTVGSDRRTMVGGSRGWLEIDTPWFHPGNGIRLHQGLQAYELGTQASDQGLYAREADAFAGIVLQGDAPWMSAADTLGNLRVLDALRQQIGLPVTFH